MNAAILILALCQVGELPATVTQMDGATFQGELVSLSATEAKFTTGDGEKVLPLNELMLVELDAKNIEAKEGPEVTLTNGSLLLLQNFALAGGKATLSTALGTELKDLPVQQFNAVRFGTLDKEVSAKWDVLKARESRDDLIVFRNQNVLDYVNGSVSQVTAEAVKILNKGRELAAPRERVFGIVFAKRDDAKPRSTVTIKTTAGDVLRAKSVVFDGDFQITLDAGTQLTVSASDVVSLDLGGARLRFLADLPFDDSASVSPNESLQVPSFVARNHPDWSAGKAPLLIGERQFTRGLWLHSGAQVRYLLNREYRELRATAGMELTHVVRMPQFDPQVRLVVLADGDERFSQEFTWSSAPVPLQVDLENVRELIIRVESLGSSHGTLEHFALGDAQVMK